jgi:hypothetical protein
VNATRPNGAIALARAALRLRAWARPLLLGDGRPAAPPTVMSAAWSLFLTVERCALPLQRRLSRERAGGALDSDAATVLAMNAALERERVRAVRYAAGRAARAASACAGAVAMLGAGVLAFDDDSAVDVDALELLVTPADVSRLSDALAAGSLRCGSDAEPMSAVDIRSTLPGGAPVAVPALWTAASAHPLAPGLHRLGPADQIGDLMMSGVAARAERRGTLRDLLVLQHAARAAPRASRDAVVHALAATSQGIARSLLRAAAVESPAPADDAFAESAAAAYLLTSLATRRTAAWTAVGELSPALRVLIGGGEDRSRVRRIASGLRALLVRRPPGGSPANTVRLARVARSVVRLAPPVALALVARSLARPYLFPPA